MSDVSSGNRLISFIFLFAFIFNSNLSLKATTVRKEKLPCPICGAEVETYKIMSSNNFGAQDRDFLTRAVGTQPLLTDPITCSNCYYSGYSDYFKSDYKISQIVKTQINDNKELKPKLKIIPDTKSYEIPAWIRYDLAAQTSELLGKDDDTIAGLYLSASWAVRLESNIFSKICQDTIKKVNEWKKIHWEKDTESKYDSKVLHRIALAKEFGKIAQTLKGEEQMIAGFAAVSILRYHGENTTIKQLLPTLKEAIPTEQFIKFEQTLNKSISMEQFFQTKALSLFEKVVTNAKNPKKKMILTYLCGELNRRLGKWEKAHHYYQLCIEMKNGTEWLYKWANEQKNLLPID